jgi:hypothetical protein
MKARNIKYNTLIIILVLIFVGCSAVENMPICEGEENFTIVR